ncbi:V-set and immunoglobulin domain-containing protein 10 [Bombina bombina]|uniref:V-set and immunoglobulin domain-containing protein 10 n=1 Tax=Bombina bombina TaxID=8345 RepID=UPI00235A4FDD|nr:V-set and immunoglobulin domain-containing protein 10 [Bombina bombina]
MGSYRVVIHNPLLLFLIFILEKKGSGFVVSRMGKKRILIWGLLFIVYFQTCVVYEAALTVKIGEVNGTIVLSCSNGTVRTKKVGWFKDTSTQTVLAVDSDIPTDKRCARVNESSLSITSLRIEDQGNYTCTDGSESISTVQLLISSGPYNVFVSITPNNTLPNGTIYTTKGRMLSFFCFSDSYPLPNMEWVLNSQDKKPEVFHSSTNNSTSTFYVFHVGNDFQGNYSCSAENPISGRRQTSTQELLVYYPPTSKISCYANSSTDLSQLFLFCKWAGGYPAPTLQWEHNGNALTNQTVPSNDTEVLIVSVEHSQLSDGQQFACHGNNLLIEGRSEKNTCQLQIALPILQSHPMRNCFSGENVTLSCSVNSANLPAKISWLHNLSQPELEIQPGEKYAIWQNSTLSYLTIINCSHEKDEGYYTCKAENVLGMKEINVWLSVNKPHNIVGLVSILLLLFLLVVAIITGTILYCDPQTYLKVNPFRSEATDLLVIIDSDDEEEMVEVQKPPEMDDGKDEVISDPSPANRYINKHQVMYHQPPSSAVQSDSTKGRKDLSSELVSDIAEEKEDESPREEL